MLRWLTATILALSAFITIILLLGYLLKSNEQQTRELSSQLAEQQDHGRAQPNSQQQGLRQTLSHAAAKVDNQATALTSSNDEQRLVKAKLEQQVLLLKAQQAEQELILANLTCSDNSQCQVVQLNFIEQERCLVAVNQIGASQLKKLVAISRSAQVPMRTDCADASPVTALCRNSLCQLP